MASDYKGISRENRESYGTAIGRIGSMLLADRYDDRTHFIFELLQNAEDALRRRGAWNGQRHVAFTLEPGRLTLSHFGRPFSYPDVRGVCGIAEGTKEGDQLSIGRFGIGFKSVFTFTDRPEIHSGEEDFAIENYVSPVAVPSLHRLPEETLITLPLKDGDLTASREIVDGFKRLGPGALLFLRQIEEIRWTESGGASGFYQRSAPEVLGKSVRRITVIGQESGRDEVDQNWLVFHREVFAAQGEEVGRVEIAFSLAAVKDQPNRWAVQPVATSPLVVFFPTVVPTNLGFLVQGPYRTTPSRDNIPRADPWNQHLVKETAGLLIEALRWLRDESMLDVSALRSLPLDREKFLEGSMFSPLFDAVRTALVGEELLPRFNGGYVAASQARLARTQELRELFGPAQVGQVLEMEMSAWLTGDITQDRAPEIRHYVMRELGVAEVTPMTLVPRLTRDFLQRQTDEWILRLYQFLGGQEAALRHRLETVPIIRLTDGSHVVASEDGRPKAFLPSAIETGFPTMRRAVCATKEVRGFLISLGIEEPNLVDDVVWNVLPRYRHVDVDGDEEKYAADIERILAAFNSDSKAQREKLLSELRVTPFVMVLDAGDGKDYVAKPEEVYVATDRLKQLYAGVSDVFVVDDAYACLRGESVRELLEACGALRYPRPQEAPHSLSWEQRRELRRQAGHETTSYAKDRIVDWHLHGFDGLLNLLPTLSPDHRASRARLIWESLSDLDERRGRGVFEGTYTWTHYGSYRKDFPAAFVRLLNERPWVPDANGELRIPSLVVFDSLGWKPNPFLQTHISFKPPIIDQLAKEAGIDPAALDLLRRYGITSVADLAARLGIAESAEHPEDAPAQHPDPNQGDQGDVYGGAKDLYSDDMPVIPPGTHDPDGGDVEGGGRGGHGTSGGRSGSVTNQSTTVSGGGQGGSGAGGGRPLEGVGGSAGLGAGPGALGRAPGQAGGRPFISYVAIHPEEQQADPDGLDQAARMAVEAQAIERIIASEPSLKRTPDGNPGYDLYETDAEGKPIRWVEVKSMLGSLADRPVGLSRRQLECAQERGIAYWLYVVEHATNPSSARILRIQDPWGLARTFTFDSGWAQVARDKLVAGPGSPRHLSELRPEAP